MKVRKEIDHTSRVSAPVRAEVVYLGRSEQNSCTNGKGVSIRVVIPYLLPVTDRVMRWCVVVARKKANFISYIVIKADAGRIESGRIGIADGEGCGATSRISGGLACGVAERCVRRGKRKRIHKRLIGRCCPGSGGRRIEQACGRLRQPQPQPFVRKEEESLVFYDRTANSPAKIILA